MSRYTSATFTNIDLQNRNTTLFHRGGDTGVCHSVCHSWTWRTTEPNGLLIIF
jgi:hypothetical protein